MSTKVSKDAVVVALRKVYDPDLNKDLVTLNMIRDLEIKDSSVSFTIMLTTPACPMKDKMKNEALTAVQGVEGVKNVE